MPEMPETRDVAYFFKLHLDKAKRMKKHPTKEKHWIFEVEGKARPMVVIDVSNERGEDWFVCLPLTKEGLDANGETKPDVQFVGEVIEGRESFIEFNSQKIPATLLSPRDGQPIAIKSLPDISFAAIMRIYVHKLMTRSKRERRN